MRSFGPLYEPQRTQKKNSEQLRPRSIDRWPQMVRPGTEKCKKRTLCFMFLDACVIAVLLTARILMFWCLGMLWKIKFGIQKFIFVPNIIENIFLAHLHFFGISKFRFPLFQILSSFQFFAFLNFDGVKQVGGWVGSLQKLIFTRGS